MPNACAQLNISDRTLRRWTKGGAVQPDQRPLAPRPEPGNKLSPAERAAVLDVCNSEAFSSLPPSQIVPELRLAHLEAEVGRYIEEADRTDRQETGAARTGRAAHLTGRYHRIRKEIERLLAMEEKLADAPDGQISLTDPDARAPIKTAATRAQHIEHVGYNVQSVVDAETHLIVAHEVTN